ncbi:hypothetical protein S7711_07651 [Stachybotrys chartarum IBT 7711]|uniref:Mitochondrial import inner membrane translocase subunit TIM50 n=1 Tax=Stachybotrys chartarum (strain CBS 109288 / IBT 7711) TaxID=1280523 RepID=A0A084ALL5_STACB|nr:hypothetical protein S7711_07651 [Stachybotrys chartarum IBT 7711]KFA75455.1 hypothetical protein S40288_01195 [Stachybotrys chartarum IBT 40288]
MASRKKKGLAVQADSNQPLMDGIAEPASSRSVTMSSDTAPKYKGRKAKRKAREAAVLSNESISKTTQSLLVVDETTAKVTIQVQVKPSSTSKPPQTIGTDSRQPPSAESGGVPNPTARYLLRATSPPTALPSPRRILVIMDLNGTLLHRPSKRHPFHFVERPHAKQFLSYCLDTFYVAIWSSARPDNVNKMVDRLLTPEQRAKCLLVWARDKFGLSLNDYNSRVQCYKRLTAVWADPGIVASHPDADRGVRWDQTNTVLVDDSLEKARTEPHNLLEIPEFQGLKRERTDVLPQVHDYLNALCHQSDVSSYIRENPFKLDPSYHLSDTTL